MAKYEVIERGGTTTNGEVRPSRSHKVVLINISCTCGKPRQYHFPCLHYVVVAQHHNFWKRLQLHGSNSWEAVQSKVKKCHITCKIKSTTTSYTSHHHPQRATHHPRPNPLPQPPSCGWAHLHWPQLPFAWSNQTLAHRWPRTRSHPPPLVAFLLPSLLLLEHELAKSSIVVLILDTLIGLHNLRHTWGELLSSYEPPPFFVTLCVLP